MARRADHSKEELASLVVNTAEELIAEEGIDAFSARSLSRAIGYTAGTLYHHFKDLDDIVTQVNTRTLVGLARAFAEATPSADPRQMLHNYADAFLGYITLKRNLWNALFEFRRKPGGHLFSKMRFLSAQLEAYLSDGLWLGNARHANAMARRLVAGLTTMKGTQLLYPVDANEIFVILPSPMHDALQDAGAQYHPWPSDRPGERAFRLVTAFDTDPADVDKFLSIAKGAAKAA